MCSVSYVYIVFYGVGLCFIKEFKKILNGLIIVNYL